MSYVSDNSIMKRKFDYIDAMPGAGKTEYFVGKAAALLSAPAPDHILVYVAPTVLLLKEAIQRIRKHPSFRNRMAARITMVAAPDKLKDAGCRVFDERPVKVINHLLGLSEEGVESDALSLGDILLTTHETFIQVSPTDHLGRKFATLKRCHVIFDEARQCVMESRTVRDVTYSDLPYLAAAFEVKTRVNPRLSAKERREVSWHILEIRKAPTKGALMRACDTDSMRTIPSSIRRLREEVRRFADNGRAQVYMMINVPGPWSFLLTDERRTTTTLTTLLRPTSLFNHYGKVTLTSAFFKDSQMYHFLKADGHNFRNLLKVYPEEMASILDRDTRLRQALPKRLRVAPLMRLDELASDRKPSHYRSTLTAGLLEHGMVVPLATTTSLVTETLTRNYTSAEFIDTLIKGGTVSRDPKIQRTLRQFCVPPLWVLLNECAHVIKTVKRKGLLPSYGDQLDDACLSVFNVKARYWHGTPATAVVRELYANGKLTKTTKDGRYSVYQEGAVDKKSLSAQCPPEWEARLAKYLFMDSPGSLFLFTPSTKLHGLNKYSGVHAFAHLAALNPTPVMIALYKSLLGEDYDIDLDHSVENLVQMLYRTSLRRTDVKDKVLMIVPFDAQAKMLQRKIGCAEFEYVHQPRLTPWVYQKVVDGETRKAAGKKGGARSGKIRALGLSDTQKAKRKSLNAQLLRYRKYVKDSPASTKRAHWETRIGELNVQLNAMVKPKPDL